MKKRIVLLAVALVLVATMFVGCQGGDASQILKMGESSFDGMFNSIMADNVYDDYICSLLFSSPVITTPEGGYEGDAATWTISDDGLTYTFTLKDGICFSDGTPLTAEDFAFTYTMMADPAYVGPRAYAVSNLAGYAEYNSGETDTFAGIQVIDEKTVAFTFADGMASPANIECFVYGILSKKYYEKETWDEFVALNDKPLGSGPMKFDSWGVKEFVKLSKNEKYWNGEGIKFDGFLMSYVPDESKLSALENGDVDFAQLTATAENYQKVQELPNVSLQKYMGNGYTFMCFNTTRETLSDYRVRQALVYAMDRENFIKTEYGEGLAEIGTAPISPTSWAYPTEGLNAYSYDPEKAAQLLDEAGWTLGEDGYRYNANGTKLALDWLVYTDSTWPQTLSSMCLDTWKAIGVELNIELMDFNTVSAIAMDAAPGEKDFDLYTMGFSLSADPNPEGGLFDPLAYTAGGFNASGWIDEKSLELQNAGKATFDQAERAAIYKEWALRQNEQMPTLIVVYRNEIWGVNDRVKGMELSTYASFTSPSNIFNITLDKPAA